MQLVTQRDLIRTVASRWKEQYAPDWETTIDGSSRSTYRKLKALNVETCRADDVTDVMRTATWITKRCDFCGEHAPDTVHQDEEDCDPHTICLQCAELARTLLIGVSALDYQV